MWSSGPSDQASVAGCQQHAVLPAYPTHSGGLVVEQLARYLELERSGEGYQSYWEFAGTEVSLQV